MNLLKKIVRRINKTIPSPPGIREGVIGPDARGYKEFRELMIENEEETHKVGDRESNNDLE